MTITFTDSARLLFVLSSNSTDEKVHFKVICLLNKNTTVYLQGAKQLKQIFVVWPEPYLFTLSVFVQRLHLPGYLNATLIQQWKYSTLMQEVPSCSTLLIQCLTENLWKQVLMKVAGGITPRWEGALRNSHTYFGGIRITQSF